MFAPKAAFTLRMQMHILEPQGSDNATENPKGGMSQKGCLIDLSQCILEHI